MELVTNDDEETELGEGGDPFPNLTGSLLVNDSVSSISLNSKKDDLGNVKKEEKEVQEILHWANSHRGNLRSLLATMRDYVPKEIFWDHIPVYDLVTDEQLSIAYKRAVRKIHPDMLPRNVSQSTVTASNVIFSVLREAWDCSTKKQ